MRSRGRQNGRQRAAKAASGAAMLTAVALISTGCTSQPEKVEHPSRVLQTVETTLAEDAAITGVSSRSISVDTSGATSSATAVHDPSRVVGDLPIRVTTQYRTAERVGADLSDLDGYTGRIEIDLTAENLTVRPQLLTYDVAGRARTTPDLVGAPFTIAASTVVTGISPSSIVTDSLDGQAATDGVVSADGKGDAIVQWATLLAPPRSGASRTLHLVATVDKFTVPTFTLAAQPGISADLSAQGVVSAAFGDDQTSELALQRRTIELISNVNEVLTRAGGTITEVRTNLDTTSTTLGASTANRLRESSVSLAGTMGSLAGELTSLKGELSTTVDSTRSTVRDQLRQTVSGLDALLGDTSASRPAVQLDGSGCEMVVQDPAASASVHGNLLRVSAQLEAYSAASEACKRQISTGLLDTVGPRDPSDSSCPPGKPSLTCALFGSVKAVQGVLIDLVAAGDSLVEQLQPALVQSAIDDYWDLEGELGSIADQLSAIQTGGGTGDDVEAALGELRRTVAGAALAVPGIRARVGAIHDRAEMARSLLGDPGDGASGASLHAQNRALADELCQLSNEGGIPQNQADRLRSYLTATPCAGARSSTRLMPPSPFDEPMDTRLAGQAAAWDGVLSDTDVSSAGSAVGAALDGLTARVSAIENAVLMVEDSVRSNGGSLDESLDRLRATTVAARASGTELSSTLTKVEQQQETLGAHVEEAFSEASQAASAEAVGLLGAQVRDVSHQAETSRAAVVAAFDRSIDGLTSTADKVARDSTKTIDEQRGRLGRESSSLESAVDEQTATSLTRIARSTDDSTRDVEGASALLTRDLERVMLDLGDRKVNGSGILGAMSTSAAKADSADFQLALASQSAAGYANIRSDDVAGILLSHEQFRASLDAATALPGFGSAFPAGTTSTTLYAFRIGGKR